MPNSPKDNQQDTWFARIFDATSQRELLEARKELLKREKIIHGMGEIVCELPGLLRADSDQDEKYARAWQFFHMLEECNYEAAVALVEVVVRWCQEWAVLTNKEDVLQTLDTLRAQLEKEPPERTVRVQ